MKLLIVGAGGIGGYFGGRIVQGGGDVTFLVRERRAAQLSADGLIIKSPIGDFSAPVKFATLKEMDGSEDVVVLSCKAYDLPAVIDDIGARLSPHTQILPLLNGIAHYDDLDRHFGKDRILGGLCHIGVTLADGGEILHLNKLQFLAFGPRLVSQAHVCQVLESVLARGGFPSALSTDIEQDAWEKFAMLAAYASVTCLMQAPIGVILAAPGGEAILRETFAECCDVAAAFGRAPRDTFRDQTIATFTDRGSSGASSMLRDMIRGTRIEADHIVGDMVARAERVNVAAPMLRTALARLKCYEAQRT
jgi:2-dehydropantoate 2-reductase